MPKPYIPNDKWSRRAAKEGYRARSVYKLMELDLRCHLLSPGMTVLDLGAAPGSWLQYTAERVGPRGKVIGIDLTPIAPIRGVKTFVADITDLKAMQRILGKEAEDAEETEDAEERTLRKSSVSSDSSASSASSTIDLILSDLAPKTSGVKDVDQWKSVELSEAVLAIADRSLKSGGRVVLKVLRGADFDSFLFHLKRDWKDVETKQVEASRDRSKEIYVVARKP
ncbi:MAG: RlmE family RNA methyltransferase [Candidatus Peregrinibacteria bacterium]